MSSRYIGNSIYNGLINTNRFITNATDYNETIDELKNYLNLPFTPPNKDSLFITVERADGTVDIISADEYNFENNNNRIRLIGDSFNPDDIVHVKYFPSVPVDSQRSTDLADFVSTAPIFNKQVPIWDSVLGKYVPQSFKFLSNTSINGPIDFQTVAGQTIFELGYIPSENEAVLFFLDKVPISDSDYYITGDRLILNEPVAQNGEAIFIGISNNDVTQNTIDTFTSHMKFDTSVIPNEDDVWVYINGYWTPTTQYYNQREFSIENISYFGTIGITSDNMSINIDRIILDDELYIPFISGIIQNENIDYHAKAGTSIITFDEPYAEYDQIDIVKFINNKSEKVNIYNYRMNNDNSNSNPSTQRRTIFNFPYNTISKNHVIPFISGVFQHNYTWNPSNIAFDKVVEHFDNVTLLIFDCKKTYINKFDFVFSPNFQMEVPPVEGNIPIFRLIFMNGKYLSLDEYVVNDNRITLEYYPENGQPLTVYQIEKVI